MRKFFAKACSVMLALIMVFSMTASAQSNRFKVELNTPEGKFDAALTTGFDADGCEQFILESSAIGRFLLQTDGMNLTAGSDDMGYITVSSEALREALTAVMYSVSSELPVEDIFAVINYLTGPQFAADSEVIVNVLSVEANRFAAVAMQMGLITITEQGDLYIRASFEEMVRLFAAYLQSLSQDPASLNQLAGMGIFELFQLPVADVIGQVPAMLASVAQELEATASYAGEGGLALTIMASGEMSGEFYAVVDGANITLTMNANAYGVEGRYAITGGGDVVAIEMKVNAEGVTYALNAAIQGNIVDAKVVMGDNSLTANATVAVDGVNGRLDASFDNNASVCKFNLSTPDGITEFDMNFDDSNDEYSLKYNNVGYNGYTTEKFVFEYIDEELYIAYVTTEGGKTMNNVIINGSKSFRVNATLNDNFFIYTLTGTLRMKNGALTFEGDLAIAPKSIYADAKNFGITATISPDAFNGKLTMTDSDEYYEFTLSVENGVFEFAIEPTMGGQDLGCLILKLTRTGSGYAGEFKFENIDDYTGEIDGAVNASFTLDENGLLAGFDYKDSYSGVSGNLAFTEDLFEVKFNDGMAEYRAFLEKALENGTLNVNGGLTATQQGYAMEFVKLMLNMNLMTLEHNANVTVPMIGASVESSFNGETYKFVYNVNGEMVTFTAKLVEEVGNIYLLIEGNVDGMPITAKIGVKSASENEVRLYAEAEMYGEVIGAAIVMKTEQTASSVSTTYAVEMTQSGYTQTLGSMTMTYEVLPGNLEHVEGYEMSAEELAEMLEMLISSMMY